MRARTVVLGFVGAAALLGCVAWVRAANDDLAAFRPYVIRDQTQHFLPYFLGQWAGGDAPPRPTGPPTEVRVIILDHVTRDQVESILKSRLCKDGGWEMDIAEKDYFHLTEGKGDEDDKTLSVQVNYSDYPRGVMHLRRFAGPPHIGMAMIVETRPMGKVDIWILRLKKIGRNPFDEPFGENSLVF